MYHPSWWMKQYSYCGCPSFIEVSVSDEWPWYKNIQRTYLFPAKSAKALALHIHTCLKWILTFTLGSHLLEGVGQQKELSQLPWTVLSPPLRLADPVSIVTESPNLRDETRPKRQEFNLDEIQGPNLIFKPPRLEACRGRRGRWATHVLARFTIHTCKWSHWSRWWRRTKHWD